MTIPDIGTDVHFVALQCCVHGEVNGVWSLSAVVLMDQNGVLCDVISCGIPEKQKHLLLLCPNSTASFGTY